MPAQIRKLFLIRISAFFFLIVMCVGVLCQKILAAGNAGGTAKINSEGVRADDEAQAGDEARYTLQGTVVNSETGEPVRNALVQISGNGNMFLLTGSDGKFKFEKLPNQSTTIQVQKPGFFSEEQAHESFTGYKAYSTLDSTPALIKLVPEGIIYGHITGDSGEGIEGLQIQLFVQTIREGRKIVEQRSGATTDEDGGFRIAELLPGTYFLRVGTGGISGNFPTRNSQPGAKGYAAVFYPAAEDIETAAPIQITAGKRAEIDLSMVLQPLYSVSGMVSGYQAGQPVSLWLSDSEGTSVSANVRFDNATGKFEAKGVPAGSYVLEAQMSDGRGPSLQARVPLIVNSEVSGVRIILAPTATIQVQVRAEYTKADTWRPPEGQENNLAWLSLVARGPSSGKMQFGSEVEKGGRTGTMVVRNVPPGTYSVTINPNGPMYVQSATSGTQNLLESELTVSPGGSVQPIEIVLQDDPASIEGKVSTDGPTEFATIILMSSRAWENPRIFVIDTNGTFYMQPLAPGSYTLLAVDHAEGLEYANPEVMRKYSSKMREISLSANQKAKIELELIRVGK